MKWNRAEASAWDKRWCVRAGSDTSVTATALQSPLARRRSSWRRSRGICRALSGTVLMVPFYALDRKVWLMWTTSRKTQNCISILIAFMRSANAFWMCFFFFSFFLVYLLRTFTATACIYICMNEWIMGSTTYFFWHSFLQIWKFCLHYITLLHSQKRL